MKTVAVKRATSAHVAHRNKTKKSTKAHSKTTVVAQQQRSARTTKKATSDTEASLTALTPATRTTKKKLLASVTSPTDPTPQTLKINFESTDQDVVHFFHDIAKNGDKAQYDEAMNAALKIGVTALKNAQTKVDVQTIHNEIDRMVDIMGNQLNSHNQLINDSINNKLKEYFDPQSGRFEERVNRLIRQDGELSNVMKQQIVNTSATLVRELTPLIGPGSRLLTALDPDSKQGVVGAIQWAVAEVTNEANKRIMNEFSLDNTAGSLVRLIQELQKLQDKNNANTQNYLQELSLDNQKSALNRLIRTIQDSSNALSLDVKDSSMNRLRSEIVERIDQQNKHITNMEQFLVRELSILNTQQNVYNTVAKKTPLHGIQFEQHLFQFVTQLVNGARPLDINNAMFETGPAPVSSHSAGDYLLEATGNRVGKIRNCKVGDILITMGPEHVAAGGKIVIEAKNDQSYNLQKALDEIQVARKNRDAQGGIFVFGKGYAPDGVENLKRYGSDIVVVWDPQDPVTNVYLDAALSISKALLVRRQISTNESNTTKVTLNKHLIKIKDLIGHIETEMQVFDEIRRYAETAQSANEKILQKCKLRGNRCVGLVEELNHEIVTAQTLSNLLEQITTSPADGEEKM